MNASEPDEGSVCPRGSWKASRLRSRLQNRQLHRDDVLSLQGSAGGPWPQLRGCSLMAKPGDADPSTRAALAQAHILFAGTCVVIYLRGPSHGTDLNVSHAALVRLTRMLLARPMPWFPHKPALA